MMTGRYSRCGLAAAEPGVAVGAPLHRGAHAVAVAEIEVVPHPDLVAVVDDGRAGQGEEQRVHELDLAAAVAEERGQAPADAQVDAGLRVLGVRPVHVVALLVRDHLERQLVVVAEEEHPLAVLGDGRRLLEHVHHRVAVLGLDGHEHARHEREVERGVALVALAEVGDGSPPATGWPRPGASCPEVPGVDVRAQVLEGLVGLGQVLAVGALALEQVGHGVEAQPVHAHLVQPEVDDLEHRLLDLGVVPVEIGLVRVEAMPVVRAGHAVPRPVRMLEVLEDDPGFLVALGVVAPDVEVARGRCPGETRRARWNQGCWSDVWFRTSSVMTLRPRECASRRNRLKSRRVP